MTDGHIIIVIIIIIIRRITTQELHELFKWHIIATSKKMATNHLLGFQWYPFVKAVAIKGP